MGDVVNLNHDRKRREREHAGKRGAETRARTGRTKGEREVARNEAERYERELDGKRIERAPGEDTPA